MLCYANQASSFVSLCKMSDKYTYKMLYIIGHSEDLTQDSQFKLKVVSLC